MVRVPSRLRSETIVAESRAQARTTGLRCGRDRFLVIVPSAARHSCPVNASGQSIGKAGPAGWACRFRTQQRRTVTSNAC